MDFDYSLSFHEGDNFSIEHDNREHIPKNVDADRISENIVYPENVPIQKFYEDKFQKTIGSDTFDALQNQAKRLIETNGDHAHPAVIEHWKSIAAGKVPFGYVVKE